MIDIFNNVAHQIGKDGITLKVEDKLFLQEAKRYIQSDCVIRNKYQYYIR